MIAVTWFLSFTHSRNRGNTLPSFSEAALRGLNEDVLLYTSRISVVSTQFKSTKSKEYSFWVVVFRLLYASLSQYMGLLFLPECCIKLNSRDCPTSFTLMIARCSYKQRNALEKSPVKNVLSSNLIFFTLTSTGSASNRAIECIESSRSENQFTETSQLTRIMWFANSSIRFLTRSNFYRLAT